MVRGAMLTRAFVGELKPQTRLGFEQALVASDLAAFGALAGVTKDRGGGH